jgi:S1-C subfamily serine protease
VNSGSPSAEAGLRTGDLILAVNGVPTRELALLRRAINTAGARDVKLTVTRKDAPARIVTLRW